jgi:hypothetical protein
MNFFTLMFAVCAGSLLAYIIYFGSTYSLTWYLETRDKKEYIKAHSPDATGATVTPGGFVSMIDPEDLPPDVQAEETYRI